MADAPRPDEPDAVDAGAVERRVLPLFPLSHVLLPGMPLPLHIFERRYRDLLDDVTDSPAGPAFGVVSLRSGTEAESVGTVSRGPDVAPVGTLAEIIEIERQPDGTSDLLAVGTRRFRVHRLITEGTAYLRGEVSFLPEAPGALTPALETRTRELLDVYDSYLVRLAGRGTGGELPSEAELLAYHVAARLPLVPDERQDVLAEDSTSARLVRLGRLLRREIALLQHTRSIAVSPAVLRIGTGLN